MLERVSDEHLSENNRLQFNYQELVELIRSYLKSWFNRGTFPYRAYNVIFSYILSNEN